MRKRLLVLAGSLVLALLVPAVALATQYSNVIWLGTYWDPNQGTLSSCGQAGIVDVATNYNQSLSKTSSSCATNKVLPANWLGSQVYGYKDGAYCGRTSIHYNTSATHGWQLWSQICSNGGGQQWFRTTGRSYIKYQGTWIYGEVTSPSEDY